jgi:hypothetical protein
MKTLALVLVALLAVGCKDHVGQAMERNDLADQILNTARGFGNKMCKCPDTECAVKLQEHYTAWREQALAEIAELEKKQAESVTANKEAIEEAFDAFEKCTIRFAIGRPGSAQEFKAP